MDVNYEIGEKVVFISPVGDYVDIFTLTGNVVEDHGDGQFSIEIDDPALLNAPHIWSKNGKYIVFCNNNLFWSLSDVDSEELLWLNKGKDILQECNTFYGIISALEKVHVALLGEHKAVALQTLFKISLDWLNDAQLNTQFEDCKSILSYSDEDLNCGLTVLKLCLDSIKRKYSLLN